MSKFKVGDLARCVNTDGFNTITEGKVYKIVGLWDDGELHPRITMDSGQVGGFFNFMFEDAKDAASDPIVRPNHYARYAIEPITFINANKLPFNIGNVVKYAMRYDAKNGVEDLRKAIRYLEMQIEVINREARISAGEAAGDVWKGSL